MKKNVLKRGICLLLTIMLLLGNIPAVFAAEDSGECGEGVTWKLADGVLTISGEGEMEEYGEDSDAPWHESADTITEIVIERGITHIGAQAFDACSVVSVSIGETVETIGKNAFQDCKELKELVIPASVTSIGEDIFASSPKVADVYFGGTKAAWEELKCEVPEGGFVHYNTTTVAGHWETKTVESTCEALGYTAEVCECEYVRNKVDAEGEKPDHTWADATCTAPKTCSVCGATEGEPVHTYNQEVVDEKYLKSPATAETKAVYYKSCVCGAKGEETFEVDTHTEHVYDKEVAVDQYLKSAATCTAKAVYYKSCACGEKGEETFEAGELAEHVCDKEVATEDYLKSAATCTAKAVYFKSCECGEKGEETFETGEFADHVFDKEVVDEKYLKSAATAETNAVYYKSCVCGEKGEETFEVEAHTEHVYDKEVVAEKYLKSAATCTAKAVYFKSCECGAKGEETFETGELAAHDLGQWTTTKEATCTEAGSKSRKCSRCDFAETETIAKTEHQYTSAVTAPTCTAGGYTTHTCAKCGHSYTDTAVAKLGHAMGQWVKVKEATPVAEGQEKRTCSRCGTVENRTTTYQGNALVLKDADLLKQDTVWINGMPYPVKGSGNNKYVELPSAAECLLVTYTYHVGDAKDVHTQYPTGMKVYRVTKGASGFQAAHIPALDNLLQYSGSSIRITGKKGIRMITSLTKSNKAALTGAGLAGYKLLEYGTMLCWSSEIKAGDALVLGKSFTRSNFAYKRGVADPVFATSGNLTQYTNVLVGFNNDQCKDDIAMRPYIILEDAAGKQVTLYGGTIHRSIGYIAYQNRNVFKSGTESYKYVWSIIHHVYGKKYDADYKG